MEIESEKCEVNKICKIKCKAEFDTKGRNNEIRCTLAEKSEIDKAKIYKWAFVHESENIECSLILMAAN